ncbi:MAG TPA: UDP-2,3-diacylglucosamine diphosphatase [Burkholderiales bacterium]|nr:UDP-2,3-diacylglucosamine diphosphatase [Burkholderiales bacterium]
MAVFFISDLHLCDSRPDINRVFFEFLRGPAREAEALYILGDLFEYWAGDDDLADPFNRSVAAALAEYSRAGISLRLMHGNRDFLLDGEFARACGITLLGDPYALDLFGTPTVLMHGDTLCTDDTDYQRFRAQVRDPAWQNGFLALPLEARKRQIEAVRQTSESEKTRKAPEIMDVNQGAVESALRAHAYPRLIHGHTHRPAKHIHRVDGRSCERWVLADWYRSGSYLRCDERGCAPVQLP